MLFSMLCVVSVLPGELKGTEVIACITLADSSHHFLIRIKYAFRVFLRGRKVLTTIKFAVWSNRQCFMLIINNSLVNMLLIRTKDV